MSSKAKKRAPEKDVVRKMPLLGRKRAPVVQGDIVSKRKTQVDVLDHVARGEKSLKRKDYPGSVVVHVSFTLTPAMDQRIHSIAVKRNISRSAVVRQALLNYFLQVDDEVA
jgi:hypothetical protein